MTFFYFYDIRVYNLKIIEMKKILFIAIILAAFATGCKKDIFDDVNVKKPFETKTDLLVETTTTTGSDLVRIQVPSNLPESPGNGIVKKPIRLKFLKDKEN